MAGSIDAVVGRVSKSNPVFAGCFDPKSICLCSQKSESDLGPGAGAIKTSESRASRASKCYPIFVGHYDPGNVCLCPQNNRHANNWVYDPWQVRLTQQ